MPDWMIREADLDDQQIIVLNSTLERSCVVMGCAGSGKSVLALMKARRIQEEIQGNDYKVIVFTKALCNYMNAGREELGLQNGFYYHWEWVNAKRPTADYVIVDEIQDFTDAEIRDFIGAAKKKFFFYGDTAQSIYGGLKRTVRVEEIRELLAEENRRDVRVFELYRNYRLPKPVAKIVQYVGIGIDPYDERIYASVENFIPRILRYENIEEQINSIKDIINRRNLSNVVILLPTNDKVRQVSEILSNIHVNHELKYRDSNDWHNNRDSLNFNTTLPKVMTYHSAKGLQFETVFLPCISELTNDEERRESDQKALYVAMTRTCRNLYIMYSGDIPSPLSQIPKDLYRTEDIEQIQDI